MSSLDIIIPVYNEEKVLIKLFKELIETFKIENLQNSSLKKVNYIFVNDGSTDNSYPMIKEFLNAGNQGKIINFSRNFGHQAAVTAGLDCSSSDVAAIIDADLQDPPEIILGMIDKLEQGFDVIYAVRKKRKESFLLKIPYWLFYRVLSWISEVDIPVDSGDFCIMKKKVVAALNRLPEKIRFPRGLRAWVGYKHGSYLYERAARQGGESKYNYLKLYKLATNGIASMSIKPLRLVQFFMFLSLFLSSAILILSIVKYIQYLNTAAALPLWFLATIGYVAFSTTIILVSLYIMSAYIGRSYVEIKGRPNYIVAEVYDVIN